MGIYEGDRVGRYRVDSVLGVGGMGVVYNATDTVLDRQVALKVMSAAVSHDEGFRTRFQREAATLARLDSPHVIAIYDHGEHREPHAGPETPGAPYIVTQLVPGGELGQLIRDRGVLPPRLAAQVCAQIAGALADAHAAGVVHRDVKPANVLMRDAEAAARGEPHVYLCDFGIAQTEGSSMTQAGGIAGTWGYLAPERGMGAPASPATDIYSVGCLLWACLTGTAPYRGSDVEVALAHQHAPIPQLVEDTETAAGINRVLTTAMAKDPTHRHRSAEALRTDLLTIDRTAHPGVDVLPDARTAQDAATPTATATATTTATAGPRRRRTALLGAAALLLVVGLGGGAWAILGGEEETPAGAAEPGGTGAASEDVRPQPGDLDGDGLGDLVLQTTLYEPGARLVTWRSEGDAFGEPEETPIPDSADVGPTVRGDFDGDGRADLLSATDSLRIDYADGDVTESDADALEGALFPTIADLDGDGLDDYVATGFGTGEGTRVFTALATGDEEGLTPPVEATLPDDIGDGRLEAGDVDGDGRAELIQIGASYESGPGVSLLGWTGDGFTYVARDLPLGGILFSQGFDIAQGDVDGDGAAEMVFVYLGRSNRRIRVADFVTDDAGDITVEQRKWYAGERTSEETRSDKDLRPILADYDGNGAEDLVLFRRGSDSLTLDVYLSSGETFANAGAWGEWEDCPLRCQDDLVPVDRNGL